jgi:hypothetical protein
MDAWFPKINAQGEILSGSNGIWLTDVNGHSRDISPVGTSPFWLDEKVVCFNRNDGKTQMGSGITEAAYNEYRAHGERWTGFVPDGAGRVDFYRGTVKYDEAEGLCQAWPVGDDGMVYLAPFQSGPTEVRSLVYNNTSIAQGKILAYVLAPSGLIAWQTATGTYTRQISNQSQHLSIRDDETPILGFDFLGQTYLVTQAGSIGQFVYPLGSHFGYLRRGDLYYPDGRVFGVKLRLVGSTGRGEPLFNEWIDLTSPRTDLSKVA